MRTLVLFLLCLISTAALAQDSATTGWSAEHLYRDPDKARVLAMILPGAGYAYTGEYLRGYGTWVITSTGVMIGPLWVSNDCSILTWNCNRASRLLSSWGASGILPSVSRILGSSVGFATIGPSGSVPREIP